MAFTQEDGTGIADANAYISVSEFREYHEDRGRVVDAATYPDSQVEVAIIRATDFVERLYSHRWRGSGPYVSGQGLSWPRSAYYENGIQVTDRPKKLIQAVAEYTLRALSSDLMPDPDTFVESPGTVVMERTELGPIVEEKRYDTSSSSDGTRIVDGRPVPVYPEADFLLKDLITGSGSVMRA